MLKEFIPLLRIAGPVVLAEVGWMSMGIVDTLIVGPLGPAAIGATGMGNAVFTAIAIFGMGLMLGLDTLVSQAYGARQLTECVRWLRQAVWLALALAPATLAVAWAAFVSIEWWGLHPAMRPLVAQYLGVVSLSGVPLLLYAAFRRYLQGLHIVRPIMVALISANVINAVANWMLVYGHLGMPALGVAGSAWATTVARVYMALFLFVTIRRLHHQRADEYARVPLRPDIQRIKRLMSLGAPAASQITLEVGVFAAATALAGRLDPTSSAANQIALNIASLAFMVPLGLSSAGAVRVGHAVGARDTARAVYAGWTALAVGGAVMSAIAAALFLWPEPMLRAFSADERVISMGTGLLGIAAAFQLFDGTQAVATGVLRGPGDTRTPMIMNVIGHWFLGLPVGYVLCFPLGWGVSGLWIGLSIGLIFVGVTLMAVWVWRTRRLVLGERPVPSVTDLL